MNLQRPTGKQNNVFILIAPRFDELSVTTCVYALRKAAVPVNLVGLTFGLLSSAHGLAIQPDLTLTELEEKLAVEQEQSLLIIPGGQKSTALLLSDPRVHQACEMILKGNGFVAALSSAQRLFVKSGILRDQFMSRFLAQDNLELTEFVAKLTTLVLHGTGTRLSAIGDNLRVDEAESKLALKRYMEDDYESS